MVRGSQSGLTDITEVITHLQAPIPRIRVDTSVEWLREQLRVTLNNQITISAVLELPKSLVVKGGLVEWMETYIYTYAVRDLLNLRPENTGASVTWPLLESGAGLVLEGAIGATDLTALASVGVARAMGYYTLKTPMQKLLMGVVAKWSAKILAKHSTRFAVAASTTASGVASLVGLLLDIAFAGWAVYDLFHAREDLVNELVDAMIPTATRS